MLATIRYHTQGYIITGIDHFHNRNGLSCVCFKLCSGSEFLINFCYRNEVKTLIKNAYESKG